MKYRLFAAFGLSAAALGLGLAQPSDSAVPSGVVLASNEAAAPQNSRAFPNQEEIKMIWAQQKVASDRKLQAAMNEADCKYPLKGLIKVSRDFQESCKGWAAITRMDASVRKDNKKGPMPRSPEEIQQRLKGEPRTKMDRLLTADSLKIRPIPHKKQSVLRLDRLS